MESSVSMSCVCVVLYFLKKKYIVLVTWIKVVMSILLVEIEKKDNNFCFVTIIFFINLIVIEVVFLLLG